MTGLRDSHGLSRRQKYAMVVLEHHGPGVVTSGPTAVLDGQPWINWRTAESLVRRNFAAITGEGETAEVRLT